MFIIGQVFVAFLCFLLVHSLSFIIGWAVTGIPSKCPWKIRIGWQYMFNAGTWIDVLSDELTIVHESNLGAINLWMVMNWKNVSNEVSSLPVVGSVRSGQAPNFCDGWLVIGWAQSRGGWGQAVWMHCQPLFSNSTLLLHVLIFRSNCQSSLPSESILFSLVWSSICCQTEFVRPFGEFNLDWDQTEPCSPRRMMLPIHRLDK